MNLLIPYHLLNELPGEKGHLEAAMPVTDDPARQRDLKQQIGQLFTLPAEIGGEIFASKQPGTARATIAQEFDAHPHRARKAFGSTAGSAPR